MTSDPSTPVRVDRLMTELEGDVRQARRKRLLARGGAGDYRDPLVYEGVDVVLRRALDARDHDALLLPDFMTSEDDWKLSLHLRYSSHRPLIGPALIFVKRRLLLPVMRWLYEYSLENFRRQRRVNSILFACIEELAIENAKMKLALARSGQLAASDGTAGERGGSSRSTSERGDVAQPPYP
jgi:hypothetical protein